MNAPDDTDVPATAAPPQSAKPRPITKISPEIDNASTTQTSNVTDNQPEHAELTGKSDGDQAEPAVQPSEPTATAKPPAAPPQLPANQVGTAPQSAADTDIIEEEWVHKAKQVVAETRDDPYAQVMAIHALKADYMKKRYNKDIKLTDA